MTSDKDGASAVAIDFPVELADVIKEFQESLSDLETVLHPLLSSGGRDDLHSEKMSSVDKAKLDCLSAFAVNSLVWVWMRTKGVNPKETEVKAELDRVKKTMAKLKEIQDKEKRQKVDQGAAKRMVASGLWKPGEAKKRYNQGSNDDGKPSSESDTSAASKKPKKE